MVFPRTMRAAFTALGACAGLLVSTVVRSASTTPLTELIARAGNTDDDQERQALLKHIATLPALDELTRAEAAKLTDFVRKWTDGELKVYNAQNRGHPKKEQVNDDFALSAASPLQPLTDIYLGRIIAWNLIEDSTARSSPERGPLYKRT